MVPQKVKDLYRWARYRAKKSGTEFDISIEDIQIPMFCPVLQIPLRFNKGHALFNSPTLDRKDNKRGYTKDNVWVISSLANIMKSNATPQELKAFASWVQKTYQS